MSGVFPAQYGVDISFVVGQVTCDENLFFYKTVCYCFCRGGLLSLNGKKLAQLKQGGNVNCFAS